VSELLTTRDVATILKCSEDVVARRFAKLPGVIDLGRAETRGKRRYRVLRIPKAVVEKYLSEKAGHTVRVEVPEYTGRRKFNWEEKVIRVLAKCALENGSKGDKAVFTRIRDRARVLSLVPEKLWAEISWTDEGE
jgi:hypothetical protein